MEEQALHIKSPSEGRLPLVVVASGREGLGLVQRFRLRRDHHFHLPAYAQEAHAVFYRGDRFHLAITGVLEHHMSAATALVLLRLGHQISSVVNMGAVGYYHDRATSADLAVGDVVIIHRVYRFDVDDNAHWARPIDLFLPDVNLPAVSCVTGSRYSTAMDRRSVYFPHEGQVEDMELYGLAVLLKTLGRRLLSVKYIVNAVSAGREQARQHIVTLRHRLEEALLEVLRHTT